MNVAKNASSSVKKIVQQGVDKTRRVEETAGVSHTEAQGPLLLEYKPGVADSSKLPVVIENTAVSESVGSGTVLQSEAASGTTTVGNVVANKPDFTYRGDSRSPTEIFENGFKPRGASTDLQAHALDNTAPPSIYVSTSKSSSVASEFADNVYVVRPRNGVDVNATLGTRSPFPDELEIAIPSGVSPSDIRAVTQGNVSILNPGYKP
jgi:hypothetical protein